MKKIYLLLLASAAMTANATSVSTKFDAPSMVVLEQYKQLQLNPNADLPAFDMPFDAPAHGLARSASSPMASVIVTFNSGYGVEDLEQFGLTASTYVDDMAVAVGTIDDITALSESDVVKSLSFGTKVRTLTNNARVAIGMDAVHAGTDLPQAFTGKGVVTGLYDNGLDPNHIAFFTDNNAKTGERRVKCIWNYSSSNPVTYNTPDRIANFTTDNAYVTHGTHVLGLMAGGYNGTGSRWAAISNEDKYPDQQPRISQTTVKANPFYGMATQSEIVACCGNATSANMLDGVGRMVLYAKAAGKPCVINLSLGNSVGPHDATDSFTKMLDKYGEDAIICIASGNEADTKLSVVKTLTASDKVAKTFVKLFGTSGTGSLDIWASNNGELTFTPCVYDLSTNQIIFSYPVSREGSYTVTTTADAFKRAFDGSSQLSMALNKNASGNKRTNFTLNYYLKVNNVTNTKLTDAADSPRKYALGIMVEGAAGTRIDIVNSTSGEEDSPVLSSYDVQGWSDGNGDLSINGLGCGFNVIQVGSFNTRAVCGYISNYYSFYRTEEGDPDPEMKPGLIAPYSSFGKLIDGRELPVVCSPGTGIIGPMSVHYYNKAYPSESDKKNVPARLQSTHATANGRDHAWEMNQGTSMATPILAGAVATWLEADPTLTREDVVKFITKSAVKDEDTSISGNPIQWGAGKFNAYEGLKLVLGIDAGINDVVVEDSKVLIKSNGHNAWEVFDGKASNMNVDVYNLAGNKVIAAKASNNTLQLDASQLSAGVYVVNVNGRHTAKIIVK